MRALWRGFVRIIFWSYERGTWPYDVMVIVIVLFVLLTPRKWFHDQPVASTSANTSAQLLSEDTDSQIRTYRLDATLLAPEKRATKSTPELERELHDILARTVNDLRDKTFHVLSIRPVLASDGSVLSYDVTIHP
jgi:hypothetical protein